MCWCGISNWVLNIDIFRKLSTNNNRCKNQQDGIMFIQIQPIKSLSTL